jgi:hypothetical protein
MRVGFGLVALATVLVMGCGGGGDSSTKDSKKNTDGSAVISSTGQTGNLLPTAVVAFGDAVVLDNGTPHATLNKLITLSGESSADADGDPLEFAWSVVSAPVGSQASLSSANSMKASILPDVMGTYQLSLTVSDGRGGSTIQEVTIIADNRDPTVSTTVGVSLQPKVVAGISRNVTLGALVSLDASGSTDPDLDILSISWTLTQHPAGSTAVLISGGATARIQPDILGTYKVKASATDSKGASSETEVTIVVNNRVPNALLAVYAAPTSPRTTTSFTTSVGYDVALGASGSTDPDGDLLTYKWELVSKPTGSNLTVSANGAVVQTITPDIMGIYQVRLTVSDTHGASAENLLTINVNNRKPTANVSTNATPVAQASAPTSRVPSGTQLTLRGLDSYDADGDTLTYAWGILARPANSKATIANATSGIAKFLPDLDGTYQFVLRVTDSSAAYSEKTFEVVVGSAPPRVILDHQRVMATLGQIATVSASSSFDMSGTALSYSWALDSQPAGSNAALADAQKSTVKLNPDVVGTYVVSVTASNGKLSASASAVIVADKDWSHVYNLDFTPGVVRYSRAQEHLVALSGNSVRVLDLLSGASTTISLPRTPSNLEISPDGRSAVVTMDTGMGYVDLIKGSLVKVLTLDVRPEVVGLTDEGVAYVQGDKTWDYPRVIDFITGSISSANGGASVYSCAYGFYADKLNMLAAASNCSSPSYLQYTLFDPVTHAVIRTGSGAEIRWTPFWFSEDQTFFFTSGGYMYKTATLTPAGQVSDLSTAFSVSQSAATGEVVFLSNLSSSGFTYPSAFGRLVGPYMSRDTDVTLPIINNKQSYGTAIFQTATGRAVVLVQVGSNTNSVAVTNHIVVK